MEIEKYQKIIEKTAVFPNEIGLAYCALGLNDEFGELIEKKTAPLYDKMKEAGDVWWYIAALSKQMGKSLVEVMAAVNKMNTVGFFSDEYLFIVLSKIQGKIKKVYRDGKDPKEAYSLLVVFARSFMKKCEASIGTLDEILEMNYDKLIKRHETNTVHGDGDNREDEMQHVGI